MIGMGAWVLRMWFVRICWSGQWMLYAGESYWMVSLWFLFCNRLYVYREKGRGKNKNSAQGLFTLQHWTWYVYRNLGFRIRGGTLPGEGEMHNWQQIWLVPAGIAVAVLRIYILFKRRKRSYCLSVTKTGHNNIILFFPGRKFQPGGQTNILRCRLQRFL